MELQRLTSLLAGTKDVALQVLAFRCLPSQAFTKLGDAAHAAPPGFRGFYSVHVPEQGPHGGVAVFAREDIPFLPVQLNSPREISALFLKFMRQTNHALQVTAAFLHTPPPRRIQDSCKPMCY